MKKILIILSSILLLTACNIGRYSFIDSAKTEDVALGKFFDVEDAYKFDSPPLGIVTSDSLVSGIDNAKLYRGASEVLTPSNVIILTQDNSLNDQTLTCKKCIYKTGFGDLNTDKSLINKMIKNTSVKHDEEYFLNENVISDQTIFVKKIFGDVEILPIVVGANVSPAKLDALSEWLNDNLALDSLVVFPTHFSTGVQMEVANFHDSFALSTISNFDYENLKNLASDSYESTYLFMKLMEKRGFGKMQKFGESNSASLYSEHVESVDSYQFLSFLRGSVDPKMAVSMLSFGNLPKDHDMEFGVGHPYDPTYDELADITTNKFLRDIRGERDGFLRGVDFLVYDLVNDDCRIDKKGGTEIAFCKFDQSSNDNEMFKQIGSLDVDLVYVMYEFNDGEVDKKIAENIIDSGADIFIGRGVNEVVPFEKYEKGLIFYSLGDFITDSKLFSGDSVVASGMVLGLNVTPDYYYIYTFPVDVINGYPKIIDFSYRMQKFLSFTSNLELEDGDELLGAQALVKLAR